MGIMIGIVGFRKWFELLGSYVGWGFLGYREFWAGDRSVY